MRPRWQLRIWRDLGGAAGGTEAETTFGNRGGGEGRDRKTGHGYRNDGGRWRDPAGETWRQDPPQPCQEAGTWQGESEA